MRPTVGATPVVVARVRHGGFSHGDSFMRCVSSGKDSVVHAWGCGWLQPSTVL
jgi:hypothetical protein